MVKNEALHTQMREAPIPSLITRLAIPNTVGLLVIAAYSLADSYFVSSLGTAANAAVGVSFSLHVLIQAIGYTLGMGAGSLSSRALGKRDAEAASRYATLAFFASLIGGVLVTVGGLSFCDPLLRFLGAEGAVLAPARAYVRPFLWTAPLMCAVFVLSQLLRAEGRALYAMVALAAGSICNILLDPLLITTAGLGIAGAALATMVSQGLSLAILLSAYLRHQSAISVFSIGSGRLGAELCLILTAGLPSLLRQGLSGTAAILLNRAAADAGEAAVAGMSLVSRVFLLVFSVALGIGQGMMPVVGYNRGAKDTDRTRRAFSFSLVTATLSMLAISLPLYLLAPQILSLFQGDASATEVGVAALRAQSLVLATHGIVTPTILYLQAIGKPLSGTVLASARQGIFFLPLIFTLPGKFGAAGLEWVQPLSDLASLLFALPFLFFAWRSLKKEGNADRIFLQKRRQF